MGHSLERELFELIGSDRRIIGFLATGVLDGVWYLDLTDRTKMWISPEFWRSLGRDPAHHQHLVAEIREVTCPGDFEAGHAALMAHLADPSTTLDVETGYRHADGSIVWLRCRGVAIRDADGRPVRMLGVHTSITHLKEAEFALRARSLQLERAMSRLRGAFDHSPIASALVRLDPIDFGRILDVNRAFGELLGTAATPASIASVVHPSDVAEVMARLQHLVSDPPVPMDVECRLTDDAAATHVRLVASETYPTWGPDGEQTAAVLQVEDVTLRRAALDRVRYIDGHDQLTGLANRAVLQERLAAGLTRMQLTPSRVGLVLLDLDHFKVVNEALGHAAGDMVLLDVAARLNEVVREGDTVARLGGDEFAVLCVDLPAEADRAERELDRIAQRILGAISSSLPALPGVNRVSASAGTRLADASDAAAVVLADADAAMYSAKQAGRRRIAKHVPSLRAAVEARHHLENELRVALARDGLSVAYQPIVDLTTDHVSGAEALIRWDHPSFGRVPPDQFIPLAESTGLIVPLGEYVLRRVCSDLALRPGWDRPGFQVAVNVSGVQLAHADVAGRVEILLARNGLAPDRLHVELTESVLLDASEDTRAQLRLLADIGVGISIDDFGTGYSSLTYLRQHPVTAIKIDRSFTAGLGRRSDDDVIVAALVDLAGNLGLGVIAEGVETPEQAAHLRRLGCRWAQGYLFGRPGPADDLRPGAPLPDELRSRSGEMLLL